MGQCDMSGFTKLFNSILHSTVWSEPNEVRILWITMLAMANKHGEVMASVPGLARMAGITIDETEHGLSRFMEPDPYSRTPDHEGRRIEKVEGGWLLLNHGKYRALMSAEERREYNRRKQAERRAKLSMTVNDKSMTISTVSTVQKQSTEAEAEAEKSHHPPKEHTARSAPSGYAVPPCFESVEGFTAALSGWIESRKKLRKPATGRAIQILIDRLAEQPDRAIAALDAATERGWLTVKWDWLDKSNGHRNGNGPSRGIEIPDHELPRHEIYGDDS